MGSWGSTGTPRSSFWAGVWPEGPEDPGQGPVKTVGSRASISPVGEGRLADPGHWLSPRPLQKGRGEDEVTGSSVCACYLFCKYPNN